MKNMSQTGMLCRYMTCTYCTDSGVQTDLATMKFRVGYLNTMLLPVVYSPLRRGRDIGNWINAHLADCEAVVATEVFSPGAWRRLRSVTRRLFPFAVGPLALRSSWRMRGGVAILSRHKILGTHAHVFHSKKSPSWDALVSKGYVLGRVQAPGGAVDVLGAHMQSTPSRVSFNQWRELLTTLQTRRRDVPVAIAVGLGQDVLAAAKQASVNIEFGTDHCSAGCNGNSITSKRFPGTSEKRGDIVAASHCVAIDTESFPVRLGRRALTDHDAVVADIVFDPHHIPTT